MNKARTRTYGEVLLGKTTKQQKVNSECVSYKIDVDKYKNGEFVPITEPKTYESTPISAEILKQIPCSNIETINNTRKIAKERREEMPAKILESKPTKEQLAEDQKILTKKQAAEKYGCGRSTIQRWTKEYELGHWTKEEEEVAEEQKIIMGELAEPEPKWEGEKPECFGENYYEDSFDIVGCIKECSHKDECFRICFNSDKKTQSSQTPKTPLSEAELCPEGGEKATEGDYKGREGKTLTEACSEADDFSMPEPFGVVSRDVWESHRMIDLSRAISAHIAFGKLEPVKPWMDELGEFVEKKTGWVDKC